MKFKNESELPVIVKELGLTVEKGGTIDLPDEYARPGRRANGSRAPSVIEQLAPQLKPADKGELADWLQAPEEYAVTPASRQAPTPQQLIAQGHPPGVAELMAKRKAAEIDAQRLQDEFDAKAPQHEALMARAAEYAAREQDARERHEEEQKHDQQNSSKLAAEGKKRLAAEDKAKAKLADASASHAAHEDAAHHGK